MRVAISGSTTILNRKRVVVHLREIYKCKGLVCYCGLIKSLNQLHLFVIVSYLLIDKNSLSVIPTLIALQSAVSCAFYVS